MAQKKKNLFTSSSNILREVPETDKEERLRERERGERKGGKNKIVRYAVSSIVRRSLKVTWRLLREDSAGTRES